MSTTAEAPKTSDAAFHGFTGDVRLRRRVADEPAPDPADLAAQAQRLLASLPDVPRSEAFTDQRAEFVAAHLRALACAGRKFAGERIGFVDEVRDYFDVESAIARPMPASTRCSAAAARSPNA